MTVRRRERSSRLKSTTYWLTLTNPYTKSIRIAAIRQFSNNLKKPHQLGKSQLREKSPCMIILPKIRKGIGFSMQRCRPVLLWGHIIQVTRVLFLWLLSLR